MASRPVEAGGIPEPDQVLYGTITVVNGNQSFRLTAGTLTLTYQPSGGGQVVVGSTFLTNINDQFSYILRLQCETILPGQTLSPNTLQIATGAHPYDRSQVFIDGSNPVTFVTPAQNSVVLTSIERGRLDRVDLRVSMPLNDADGDGLPDIWEQQYLGGSQFGSEDDPDGDGMSNMDELKAGTNPNDANSRFAFIQVSAHPSGGSTIEWSSVAGEAYELQRSSDLMTGFSVLQAGIQATAPINSYHDVTAVGNDPYFYRLKLDE